MKLRNDAESWGWPARLLHWAMAVLILFMLGLGFYMVELLPDSALLERFALTQLHKSWGFVAFSLALARLLWRGLAGPTPAEPPGPAWQARAARASHLALYLLMIWMPVSGWLMASASPLNDAGAYPMQIRNMVFGLFELPDPFQPGDRGLEAALKAAHLYGAIALATIVGVHAGAALKHHLVDRDTVLRRMTWGR